MEADQMHPEGTLEGGHVSLLSGMSGSVQLVKGPVCVDARPLGKTHWGRKEYHRYMEHNCK
jgi:hypothetical protein